MDEPVAKSDCLTCEKASNLAPDKTKQLGLGSMTYAGLFLIEGIGLWNLETLG
jgi:hypothetical protein